MVGIGVVIIAVLIYVLAILIAIGLVLGIIAYLLFPIVIEEFKRITLLYYNMELKKALLRHFVHFLLFAPIALIILYLAFISNASFLYLLALFIFLGSAFVGFYIFLYFAWSAYNKNIKKVIISLLLGGAIFIFFAPSTYFVFAPIYRALNHGESVKTITKNRGAYDNCHDREDFLMGGFCTSQLLSDDDIIGKWILKEDNSNTIKGKDSYFILDKNGTVSFHGWAVRPAKGFGYYDDIERVNGSGSWKLTQNEEIDIYGSATFAHPYITIDINDSPPTIIFKFDSQWGTLFLTNQFDDIDAPYYLRYQRVEPKKDELNEEKN